MAPHMKPARHPVTYWRLRRRWTLKDLSTESGISLPHVAAIETGRRGGSPQVWAALSRALGVPVPVLRPPDAIDEQQPDLFPRPEPDPNPPNPGGDSHEPS